MATLADIRRRIASMKNTQQITRAMQAVAASKLRKAQARAQAARPYAERMEQVLSEVAERVSGTPHPFLSRRTVRKRLLILVTADRGLAGALNVNVQRAALQQLRQGPPVVLVPIVAEVSQIGDRPELKTILPVVTVAMDEYLAGNVDEVSLAYTRFVSMTRLNPTITPLIPVTVPERKGEGPRAEHLYEPEPEEVLARLLPRYVEAQVYAAVLDNIASFYSAQMIAMRNATDNAGELIQDLTLLRNKVRQATITKELMEIVGGAEALAAGG